jgi:LacI family sucrose operon transcriptional repressor
MLNDRVRVSQKTREKIYAAMEEINYHPNEIARALSKQRNNMIGLIVPSATNYFFCKVIHSVEKYASQYGYKLLLCISNHEQKKELEYLSMLKANKVEGIILASHTQSLETHLKFDVPIISFERLLPEKIPSVCSDNYHGGELAALHLLEKGCKRPAYFSDFIVQGMSANLRYNGFADTLRKNGIEAVIYATPEERFMQMEYGDCIEDFFRRNPGVDGVFTSNDVLAVQIVRYCGKKNIAVPGRIKIIGYDGIDLAGFCTPALTTIRQPIDDNCRFAVEYLATFPANTVSGNTVFPVELVQGEST